MGFPVFIAGRNLLGEHQSGKSLSSSVQAGEDIKYNQNNQAERELDSFHSIACGINCNQSKDLFFKV